MIRTAILGASGYVGGELLRLLAAHPELAPAKLFGETKAGQKVATAHPHLASFLGEAEFERFEESALDGIDLLFAALPHGHSQRLAALILGKGLPFVDLGADFRLDDAPTYERWYGHTHAAPALLEQFVYGIPELNREAVRGARAVAAAGCYATAAILALSLVMPGWLAALLVAAVLLIVAVILALIGYRVLKKGIPPVPTESIDSVRRDIQAIKGMGKRSTP